MNSIPHTVTPSAPWPPLVQVSGRNTNKALVDDAALIAAGYEEIIDILDDGEMVLTQLTQPGVLNLAAAHN